MRERTSHSVHCQWVQEFMEHAKELYYREFTEKTDSPEYNYEWTYLEGRVYCVRHKKTGVISLVQASNPGGAIAQVLGKRRRPYD